MKTNRKQYNNRHSEQRSGDLAQDCCWGDFRLLRLFHRGNVGYEVDIRQLGDFGLVNNLVAEIQGNVDWDVDVWEP